MFVQTHSFQYGYVYVNFSCPNVLPLISITAIIAIIVMIRIIIVTIISVIIIITKSYMYI